jgi:hypothetical protein
MDWYGQLIKDSMLVKTRADLRPLGPRPVDARPRLPTFHFFQSAIVCPEHLWLCSAPANLIGKAFD